MIRLKSCTLSPTRLNDHLQRSLGLLPSNFTATSLNKEWCVGSVARSNKTANFGISVLQNVFNQGRLLQSCYLMTESGRERFVYAFIVKLWRKYWREKQNVLQVEVYE